MTKDKKQPTVKDDGKNSDRTSNKKELNITKLFRAVAANYNEEQSVDRQDKGRASGKWVISWGILTRTGETGEDLK